MLKLEYSSLTETGNEIMEFRILNFVFICVFLVT